MMRHCFEVVHKEIYNINIAKRRHSVFVYGLVSIIYIGLCLGGPKCSVLVLAFLKKCDRINDQTNSLQIKYLKEF